jgi:hypothetical protein
MNRRVVAALTTTAAAALMPLSALEAAAGTITSIAPRPLAARGPGHVARESLGMAPILAAPLAASAASTEPK